MRCNELTAHFAAAVLGTVSLLAAAPAYAAAMSATAQAAAQSEGFANSAIFNSGFGSSSGQENQLTRSSNRDANGNMVIVNGIMGTGNVSQQDGFHQSGVGGTGGASATAIGNNLNVQVTGAWNTVIVDSKQINKGDQNATATLNGKLNF